MGAQNASKPRNISGFTVGAALLGVTLGGTNLWAELRHLETLSERPVVTDVLYLPSPVEAELLGAEFGLWPRLFNADHPPLAERAPEIYGGFSLAPKAFPKLSPEELDRARRWSVAMSLNDFSTLERTLPQVPDPAEILEKRGLQDCTLMQQEVLYRWSQLRPTLREPFVTYLDNCDAKTVVHDWLMLQVGLESKSHRLADRAIAKLKLRSFVQSESWASWFAARAARYGELKLNPPAPEASETGDKPGN